MHRRPLQVEERPTGLPAHLAANRPLPRPSRLESMRTSGSLLTRALVLVLGLAGLIGIGFLLEAASVHAYAGDSDGASIVLVGNAVEHGNLLLHGWNLSLDSFWLVDSLWYAGGIVFGGVGPALMHAVPAAIAAACIGIGVLMATEGRRGFAAVAAGATVVVILGLPSNVLSDFLLRGPLHVGTACWALVAFLAMRRGRFGIGWFVAVAFLAAGILGDLQMLALGTMPLGMAGITAALRTRDWRRAPAPVSAAIASVVLWKVARKVTRAIGAFSISASNPTATLSEMLHELKHGVHEFVLLLGVGSAYFGPGAAPKGLSDVHLVSVVLIGLVLVGAVCALAWGVIRGRSTVLGGDDEPAIWLDDMLLFAVAGSGGAYLLLGAVAPDPEYTRYLTAAVIFSAILAGRIVGRLAQRIDSRAIAAGAATLALAVASCYAAVVGYNVSAPAPPSSATAIGQWLAAHHLTRGMGSYWSASIVTVESHGKVKVRPVLGYRGTLVRYDKESTGQWYDHRFQFLVFQVGAPWGDVNSQSAVHTFGNPSVVYTVGSYTVMVWPKGVVVPRRRQVAG